MQLSLDTPVLDRPLAWERPALAGGILFAVGQIAATAYFVSVIAPHLPPLDASLAQQGAFYSEYAAANAVSNYLFVLPVPFFLLFLGGLFGVLRRLEGGVGVLTATVVGAGIALSMVWPIGIIVADSGQMMARQGLDPAAVMGFDGVAQLMLGLSAFPRAVLLLGASVGLLSSSSTPRWIGWAGLGLALVGLAGTAILVDANLYPLLALGTLLFDVWVGVVGGTLLRRVTAIAPSRVGARQASLAAS